MDKYFKAEDFKITNGFITSDDQSVDNLSFSILFSEEGFTYLKVTGEENKIDAWALRTDSFSVGPILIEEKQNANVTNRITRLEDKIDTLTLMFLEKEGLI